MTRARRVVVLATALVVVAACSGGGPSAGDGAGSPGASTPAPASSSTSEGLESSVSTRSGTVTSSVEVRVAEIISDYHGVATEAGTTLTVPSEVLFDFDEATLRPDARARLDEIVEVVGYFAQAPVEVVGHTDSQGEPAYNQDLSTRRADAVATHLVDAGVDTARLSVEGRGETEPDRPNDTEEGRQANRRVEITIVGVQPPDAG